MVTPTLALFCVLALWTTSTLSQNHCPKLQKHVEKPNCSQIYDKNVSNLTPEWFTKSSWEDTKCIILQNNTILSIQRGLFSKFKNLEKLRMKNIPKLGAGIRDGFEDMLNLTRLKTLCLENVGLTTPVVKYIIGLLPDNLWYLIFRNNSIEYFSLDFIRKFEIRSLILSSNKNLNFSIGSIPKTYTWLRTLDLSHTGFFSNATLCPKNKTIMQNLRNLSLNGNLLRLSVIDRKECKYRKLKHLSLSDCHLEDGLHNSSFSNFPNLYSLNLNGLKNNSKIQLPTFQENKQLEELNLNNISYNFPPSDENTAAFKYLTELTKLQMNQWNLSQWNSTHFSLLFKPFVNSIKYLDISSVGINSVPNIIWNMQNLYILKMNKNRISKVVSEFNYTNKNLSILHLKWNRIETLNPNLLPRSLTEINLTGNPFNCNCQLMQYAEWMFKKGYLSKSKVPDDWYYGRYLCQKPRDWKGKVLAQFILKLKRTDCLPFNIYVITAICLCFLMVICVIVTNVVVWYRSRLKIKQKCGEEEPLLSQS